MRIFQRQQESQRDQQRIHEYNERIEELAQQSYPQVALLNQVKGVGTLAKSYGERLRGCNVRNMNPEKANELSPELQRALEPLLTAIESLSTDPYMRSLAHTALIADEWRQGDARENCPCCLPHVHRPV
jgi:hypothetical protein